MEWSVHINKANDSRLEYRADRSKQETNCKLAAALRKVNSNGIADAVPKIWSESAVEWQPGKRSETITSTTQETFKKL